MSSKGGTGRRGFLKSVVLANAAMGAPVSAASAGIVARQAGCVITLTRELALTHANATTQSARWHTISSALHQPGARGCSARSPQIASINFRSFASVAAITSRGSSSPRRDA